MEGFLFILGGIGAVALVFAVWLNTKPGKKWLANL